MVFRNLVFLGVLMALGSSAYHFFQKLGRARVIGESLQCRSHLNQLALGILLYSGDHEGRAPKSWAEMTRYLSDPRVLGCPRTHPPGGPALSWEAAIAAATYPLETKGRIEGEPVQILTRCPLHGNAIGSDQRLVDGSLGSLSLQR